LSDFNVVVINDNSDPIDIAVKIRFMKKASIPLEYHSFEEK
jgi:hypothetical protein